MLAGYFFNRQLHFLVAGQRVPAILSNFLSDLSNQHFQPFQLLLCVLLPEADPNAGDRNAHFQQAVKDAGMGGILWVSYLVQCQVGGDDAMSQFVTFKGIFQSCAVIFQIINAGNIRKQNGIESVIMTTPCSFTPLEEINNLSQTIVVHRR